MKKIAFVALMTLAGMWFAHQGYAQSTLAPLYLSSGDGGGITPFQNGQLLEVGQSYEMTAIPDSSFTFDNWQPVNFFVFYDVFMDPSGNLSTNTSTVASLLPDFTETVSLTFTMQPVQVIYDDPGVRTITESSGWRANFEPLPEPSSVKLVLCVFTAAVWLRRRPFRRVPSRC